MHHLDHSLIHPLNTLFAHHDALEDPMGQYAKLSELMFAAALAAFAVVGLWRRRSELVATAIAAGGATALALAAGALISSLVGRTRPFVADHSVHLFSAHAADPGFPSDHATAAFAIAMAVWLRHRGLGAVLLVAAAVLAADRVALGLHWPSDVVAGAVLGSAAAAALHQLPAARSAVDRVAEAAVGLIRRLPRAA